MHNYVVSFRAPTPAPPRGLEGKTDPESMQQKARLSEVKKNITLGDAGFKEQREDGTIVLQGKDGDKEITEELHLDGTIKRTIHDAKSGDEITEEILADGTIKRHRVNKKMGIDLEEEVAPEGPVKRYKMDHKAGTEVTEEILEDGTVVRITMKDGVSYIEKILAGQNTRTFMVRDTELVEEIKNKDGTVSYKQSDDYELAAQARRMSRRLSTSAQLKDLVEFRKKVTTGEVTLSSTDEVLDRRTTTPEQYRMPEDYRVPSVDDILTGNFDVEDLDKALIAKAYHDPQFAKEIEKALQQLEDIEEDADIEGRKILCIFF